MRDRCEVLDWAASGAMALTGTPDEAPVASPAPALAMLAQVSAEFARVTARTGTEVRADPAELIAGRAALADFTRGGRVSAGGSTFLLRAADGWCAVTLSRPEDVAAVPAIAGLLGAGGDRLNAVATLAEARSALTTVALGTKADDFAAAAQLAGVPAGALPAGARPPEGPPPDAPRPGARSSGAGEASLAGATGWPPWRATRIAEPLAGGGLGGGGLAGGGLGGAEVAGTGLAGTGLGGTGLGGTGLGGAVVADLSSMWAGPLCARLLGLAGAEVIKVESPARPDGARSGNREFFDWLHAGHRSLSVDFGTRAGRAVLTSLLEVADVVIESSRPRALAAMKAAPGMIRHPPGQVWLSITGYGRSTPERVAFGDDAAVAGGLVGWTGGGWTGAECAAGEPAGPVFCADAIADPLTGACGALAVALSRSAGGGELIDLPMRDVAAAFAAAAPDHGPHDIFPGGPVTWPRTHHDLPGWSVSCPRLHRVQAVLPPRRPAAPAGTAAHAAELGADTSAVLAWLADRRAAC